MCVNWVTVCKPEFLKAIPFASLEEVQKQQLYSVVHKLKMFTSHVEHNIRQYDTLIEYSYYLIVYKIAFG
jgi:hypothetical protein